MEYDWANNSNLSVDEAVRYMPEEIKQRYPFIERMAGQPDYEEALCNIDGHISEAKGFPSEDFLEGVMEKIQMLMPATGAKVAAFKEILEELQRIQDETARTTEYSMDELCKAEKIIASLAE